MRICHLGNEALYYWKSLQHANKNVLFLLRFCCLLLLSFLLLSLFFSPVSILFYCALCLILNLYSALFFFPFFPCVDNYLFLSSFLFLCQFLFISLLFTFILFSCLVCVFVWFFLSFLAFLLFISFGSPFLS